jgi:hypothetical protein
MRFAFRRQPPSNVVAFPTERTTAEIERAATYDARLMLGVIVYFTVLAATPIAADHRAVPMCRPVPALHHHGATR